MSATMERQSIQDMVNEIRRDKDRNGPPPRLWQLMYEHDGGEFYMEVDDKDVNDAWADFVVSLFFFFFSSVSCLPHLDASLPKRKTQDARQETKPEPRH